MLIETWLDIELGFGQAADSDQVTQIKEKLPIKVKKRRPIAGVDADQTLTD